MPCSTAKPGCWPGWKTRRTSLTSSTGCSPTRRLPGRWASGRASTPPRTTTARTPSSALSTCGCAAPGWAGRAGKPVRVLMLTRRIDRDDPRAGFAHRWVEALARYPRVEGVDVICLEMGEHALPPNVTVASMGKERGYGRLREMVEFARAINRVIRRTDVIFGHMIPRYVVVAAPW